MGSLCTSLVIGEAVWVFGPSYQLAARSVGRWPGGHQALGIPSATHHSAAHMRRSLGLASQGCSFLRPLRKSVIRDTHASERISKLNSCPYSIAEQPSQTIKEQLQWRHVPSLSPHGSDGCWAAWRVLCQIVSSLSSQWKLSQAN